MGPYPTDKSNVQDRVRETTNNMLPFGYNFLLNPYEVLLALQTHSHDCHYGIGGGCGHRECVGAKARAGCVFRGHGDTIR
jgi:hypothetical protein